MHFCLSPACMYVIFKPCTNFLSFFYYLYYILYSVFCSLYPVSCIVYHMYPQIQYPACFLVFCIMFSLNPVSCILYPLSFNLYHLSFILYNMYYSVPCISYPLFFILFLVSFILYPVSCILPSTRLVRRVTLAAFLLPEGSCIPILSSLSRSTFPPSLLLALGDIQYSFQPGVYNSNLQTLNLDKSSFTNCKPYFSIHEYQFVRHFTFESNHRLRGQEKRGFCHFIFVSQPLSCLLSFVSYR